MTKRGVVVAGSLALALGLLAVDVPLKYERCGDDGGSGWQPRVYVLLEKSVKLPAGDWKLPELKSSLPVYACADIGGKKRLLVLDKRDAKDPFYNRLYLDANGNNDLRDDPVIETPRLPEDAGDVVQYRYAPFPAVDITIDHGAYKTPYSMRLSVVFGGKLPEGGLTAKDIEGEYFSDAQLLLPRRVRAPRGEVQAGAC